jgi:hypothetical protein
MRDWKTRLKTYADKESKRMEEAAEEMQRLREIESRRKADESALAAALFDLKRGALDFCDEARAAGIDAEVEKTDFGFAVRAPGIRFSVLGNTRVWPPGAGGFDVFWTAEGVTDAPMRPQRLPRIDDSIVPELISDLLL